MYAVIETSGRQYRVELGSEIELDQLDAEPGSTIELGRVLLVADGDDAHIGQPVVDGARVTGEVVRHDRGDKIVVFKYRPKARTRVKKGHRADLTIVRISDIVLNGRSAADQADAQARREAEARQAAEKEAARKAAADKALADRLAAEHAAESATDEPEQATGTARSRGSGKGTARANTAEKAGKSSKANQAKGQSEPKRRTTRATAASDEASEADTDTDNEKDE
ncbi:MAG TPA: 50S ribosomal protein L21 [Candidatus Limnocylindrales bacterium]|nr:50S ribosomal protein L21 [Candidatus Limnocylindrales bacterium]